LLCPVCNGLYLLDASCPQCGSGAEDEGRPEDWSGPYSPYEVSPRAVSSGSPCVHLANCPSCGNTFFLEVEIRHA
jgi:rRNA maturation protein Nop10